MAAVTGKSNGEIERSSTMKILLLGATGLVGKNVLAQALAPSCHHRRGRADTPPIGASPKTHQSSVRSPGVAAIRTWPRELTASSVRWERRSARPVPKRHFARWTTCCPWHSRDLHTSMERRPLSSSRRALPLSTLRCSIQESKARSSETSSSWDSDHSPSFDRASSAENGTNRASAKASPCG